MNSTLAHSDNLPLTGLVELYRDESSQPVSSHAALLLLTRFQHYLSKWVRLLAQGKWDHKDHEIRHFLQMMGSKDIEKTAYIVSLRMKAYEKEDIEQDITLVFLETALRTRSIRQHFRYALQKKVVSLLRDPLVYNHDQHLQLNEAIAYAPAATDIDELWVAGFTCGPGFDELSPHERKILQLHHYQGFTIESTARAMGIGTATVSRVISKARKILATHYVR